MNEIIIEENKRKLSKLIISGIIVLIISIYMLMGGIIERNFFYILLGMLGIVFLGTGLIYIIKRRLSAEPLVVISEEGITDMSTMTSVGFINWNEIESVCSKKVFRQKYIEIVVYDLDKVMNRISF